jgi:hypothetical protein
MNTPYHNIEKIDGLNIQKDAKIVSLAQTLYNHREQNQEYGNYLLEKKPDSYHDIAHDLIVALTKNEHHSLYIMTDQTKKELGYILLKNYADYIIDDPIAWHSISSEITPNLEASYRTIKRWTCTPAIRHVLNDVLVGWGDIHAIMWHHAVANKSSGAVFHANGFSVVKYHKDYVYLPNIDERSDTILWKLDKEQYIQDSIHYNGDLKKYLRKGGLRINETQDKNGKDLQKWYGEMQTRRLKKYPVDQVKLLK